MCVRNFYMKIFCAKLWTPTSPCAELEAILCQNFKKLLLHVKWTKLFQFVSNDGHLKDLFTRKLWLFIPSFLNLILKLLIAKMPHLAENRPFFKNRYEVGKYIDVHILCYYFWFQNQRHKGSDIVINSWK